MSMINQFAKLYLSSLGRENADIFVPYRDVILSEIYAYAKTYSRSSPLFVFPSPHRPFDFSLIQFSSVRQPKHVTFNSHYRWQVSSRTNTTTRERDQSRNWTTTNSVHVGAVKMGANAVPRYVVSPSRRRRSYTLPGAGHHQPRTCACLDLLVSLNGIILPFRSLHRTAGLPGRREPRSRAGRINYQMRTAPDALRPAFTFPVSTTRPLTASGAIRRLSVSRVRRVRHFF